MKTKALTHFLISSLLSACATTRKNDFIFSVGAGAAVGAASGAALSPNAESRPWNAVIFGLTGALAGGAINYLLSNNEPAEKTNSTLKDRESSNSNNVLVLNPPLAGELPDFLKKRLSSLVIEELTLPPTVGEDGTLQEPHKAYRIKQQPELLPIPDSSNSQSRKDRK